jgi:hypothetical protein
MIIFRVTNKGSLAHELIAARTTSAPGDLSVENGRVLYYSYSGEPEMFFYDSHGGWSTEGSRVIILHDHDGDEE